MYRSDPSKIGWESVSKTSFRRPEVGSCSVGFGIVLGFPESCLGFVVVFLSGLRLGFFRAAERLFGGCADMVEMSMIPDSISMCGWSRVSVGKQPNAVVVGGVYEQSIRRRGPTRRRSRKSGCDPGVRHLGMSDIECELPLAFTVTQPSTDHPEIASIGYSGMSEIGDVPRSSKIVGRAEVQIQRLIFSHLVNDWHLWNA